MQKNQKRQQNESENRKTQEAGLNVAGRVCSLKKLQQPTPEPNHCREREEKLQPGDSAESWHWDDDLRVVALFSHFASRCFGGRHTLEPLGVAAQPLAIRQIRFAWLNNPFMLGSQIVQAELEEP